MQPCYPAKKIGCKPCLPGQDLSWVIPWPGTAIKYGVEIGKKKKSIGQKSNWGFFRAYLKKQDV